MPCSFGILVLQPGTETRTEPGPLPSAMKAQSPNHWTAKDTTEWLHFDFSLSCIGEGNGNPLQCSCLENPTRTGEPDGLPSMGLHRVGHDWSDLAAAAFIYWWIMIFSLLNNKNNNFKDFQFQRYYSNSVNYFMYELKHTLSR